MQRLSESKIPDSIEATTLRPKMKEFKEFASYISKIETKQNLSFVKVSLILDPIVRFMEIILPTNTM